MLTELQNTVIQRVSRFWSAICEHTSVVGILRELITPYVDKTQPFLGLSRRPPQVFCAQRLSRVTAGTVPYFA